MRRFLHLWSLHLITGGLCFALVFRFALSTLDELAPFPIERLEAWPQSLLLTDEEGRVLIEIVGTDGYRRRPVPLAKLSPLLVQALIAVEDNGFWSHDGVDPTAIARAIVQNLQKGKVFSGASTITMQVCRMLDDRPRTLPSKLIESFRAWQLERIRSKHEILEIYLNLIPCGGNIRGVESASQLYFKKSAATLALSEVAMIAGLPQSPDRYAPDKNPKLARARRNIVLWRMNVEGVIDDDRADQAREEPLLTLSEWLPQESLSDPRYERGFDLNQDPQSGNEPNGKANDLLVVEGKEIQVTATGECSQILVFDGRVRVDLRDLASHELQWFLNDKPLTSDWSGKIVHSSQCWEYEVPAGRHQLSCRNGQGERTLIWSTPKEPDKK